MTLSAINGNRTEMAAIVNDHCPARYNILGSLMKIKSYALFFAVTLCTSLFFKNLSAQQLAFRVRKDLERMRAGEEEVWSMK